MIQKKVLIIDDAQDLVRAISFRLRNEGYDVQMAFDAIEGTAMGISGSPDLILLDLGLPGGDGYTVLRNFRMLAATCHIPVIVFTAQGKAGEEKALNLGAAAYLTKPCESRKLLDAIKTALDKSNFQNANDMLG